MNVIKGNHQNLIQSSSNIILDDLDVLKFLPLKMVFSLGNTKQVVQEQVNKVGS